MLQRYLKMFLFFGPRLQMWAPMPASRKRAGSFWVAQHSHSLMILLCRTFLYEWTLRTSVMLMQTALGTNRNGANFQTCKYDRCA